jgi:hypothetical protein
MSANQDLTFYAKRDNTIDLSIITNAGEPVDLSGNKFLLTIKALLADADTAALYQGPPAWVNLPFGRITFLVPLATTQGAAWHTITQCVYDISMVTQTGKWATIMAGLSSTIVQPVAQSLTGASTLEEVQNAN